MGIDAENYCLTSKSVYQDWLAEKCTRATGLSVSCSDAFEDWQAFAKARGEFTAGSKQAFGRAMSENRLYSKMKRSGNKTIRIYNDLVLISSQVTHA